MMYNAEQRASKQMSLMLRSASICSPAAWCEIMKSSQSAAHAQQINAVNNRVSRRLQNYRGQRKHGRCQILIFDRKNKTCVWSSILINLKAAVEIFHCFPRSLHGNFCIVRPRPALFSIAVHLEILKWLYWLSIFQLALLESDLESDLNVSMGATGLHFSNASIKSLNEQSLEGIYLFTRGASYTIFIPVDQHNAIVPRLHAATRGLSASQRHVH